MGPAGTAEVSLALELALEPVTAVAATDEAVEDSTMMVRLSVVMAAALVEPDGGSTVVRSESVLRVMEVELPPAGMLEAVMIVLAALGEDAG